MKASRGSRVGFGRTPIIEASEHSYKQSDTKLPTILPFTQRLLRQRLHYNMPAADITWIKPFRHGRCLPKYVLQPMKSNDDNESGRTQLGPISDAAKSLQGERRPALVSLRGELLAVSIPLERDEVTLGRALEAGWKTLPKGPAVMV